MKILLISDDKEYADDLCKKLVFLRNTDSVTVLNYADAVCSAELQDAQVVLVHNPNTLDLIYQLRKNPDLCIILLANSYDRELILASADAGIDDFILASAEDFELVIRIVNNIKHNSIKLASRRNEKLLKHMNVIDNGLYLKDYYKELIDNTEGVFIVLSPAKSAVTCFSYDLLADAARTSVRPHDILFKGEGVNLYIFLSQADFIAAHNVFNRIKEKIDFDICAGVCDVVNNSYENFEESALKALSEAIANDVDFVCAEEKTETLDEWLFDTDKKNYKFFKQIFNKKLEKVIAPVFYRLQKSYEEKLIETDIQQFTNDEECIFRLKNNKNESVLKIVYPGFAKIFVQITHAGLDSPENREIQMPLNKITQKELINIAENFIKEFKENVKCK